MELILWRHAEAEDGHGKPDAERSLTGKGRKHARRMAEWLRPRLGRDWVILASPALRTLQTVEPLELPYEESEAVGLAATARGVLRAAGWPANPKNVVVVGHQPTLGEVAALLLLGGEGDTAIRKGALWWFATREREGKMATTLQAVVDPGLLDDPEPR
jgi:phosphohistidine phosphatase